MALLLTDDDREESTFAAKEARMGGRYRVFTDRSTGEDFTTITPPPPWLADDCEPPRRTFRRFWRGFWPWLLGTALCVFIWYVILSKFLEALT